MAELRHRHTNPNDRGRSQTRTGDDQPRLRSQSAQRRLDDHMRFLRSVSMNEMPEDSSKALERQEERHQRNIRETQGDQNIRTYYNIQRYGPTALGGVMGSITGAMTVSDFSSDPKKILGGAVLGGTVGAYAVEKMMPDEVRDTMGVLDTLTRPHHGEPSLFGREMRKEQYEIEHVQRINDAARKLGVPAPDLDSPEWKTFAVEGYDDILEKCGLSNHEGARYMLGDIVQKQPNHQVSDEDRHSPMYEALTNVALLRFYLREKSSGES